MNILLVGSKCRFLQLLTDKLDKEGHRVFLLTAEDKSVRTSKKIFETYHFAYDNPCIREVLEGVRPDVTVFMGAYDTGFLWGKGSSTASAYTSGLFQLLMNETAGNVGRFCISRRRKSSGESIHRTFRARKTVRLIRYARRRLRRERNSAAVTLTWAMRRSCCGWIISTGNRLPGRKRVISAPA